MSRQQALAAAFKQLHLAPNLLVLANSWDAGSARLAEHVGAAAIATTSAGLAWAHGYADGGALPIDVLVRATAEIARMIQIPLTIDIEDGYATDPTEVADLVSALVEVGAVGINIEDGLAEPASLAAKILTVRAMADRQQIDLFINARTDVYLRGLSPEPERIDETLRRAELYREAGATGLFVPALTAESDIQEIAARARLPLNLMAVPGLPSPKQLAKLGVRRLSAGAAISEALFAHAATLIGGFLHDGVAGLTEAPAMGYSEINRLFAIEDV